jgi:uncharacterized membrane protein
VTTDSPKGPPPEATASPELPDHISQNIADIVQLQHRHAGALSTAQRRLERMGRFFSRPRYLVGLFLLIGAWISYNLAAPRWGWIALDGPPFPWLEGALTFIALITATIVLIGQRRQIHLSEQRAHLDLQINLLTEQKVTKIIHLLEELRRDLPIEDRHDPQAAALKQPTDAGQVLSALQRSDLGSESAASVHAPDRPAQDP